VFRPRRFVHGGVRRGSGIVFLEIRGEDLLGALRLDLGRTRSPVFLRSIVVRAVTR
jgi:hypothetical protein